jgi:hypothetical protein
LAKQFTQLWYDEVSAYDYNNPVFSMATGHFTALVWSSTQFVGVGFAVSDGGQAYYVANYKPQGNVIGAFADNVHPIKNKFSNSIKYPQHVNQRYKYNW